MSTTRDYPAVVMVVLPGGSGLCTGTFVSSRAVLTAMHCAKTPGTYTVYSSFGTFSTTQFQNFGTGTVDDTSDLALLLFPSDIASVTKGQVLPIGAPVSDLEHVRLVGYGCNDLQTEGGAGVKRTGTNQVYSVTNYIDLMTPDDTSNRAQKILGPANRAGSCFGDSGGPLLKTNAYGYTLAGIVHAGGDNGSQITSEYINLNASNNYDFLSSMNSQYNLSLFDPCLNPQTTRGSCGTQGASMQIASFIHWAWTKAVGLFFSVKTFLHF